MKSIDPSVTNGKQMNGESEIHSDRMILYLLIVLSKKRPTLFNPNAQFSEREKSRL